MNRVNLKAYPKFWTDFADRVNQEIDPSAAVSGHDIKRWMQAWYGINVHIMHSGSLGEECQDPYDTINITMESYKNDHNRKNTSNVEF